MRDLDDPVAEGLRELVDELAAARPEDGRTAIHDAWDTGRRRRHGRRAIVTISAALFIAVGFGLTTLGNAPRGALDETDSAGGTAPSVMTQTTNAASHPEAVPISLRRASAVEPGQSEYVGRWEIDKASYERAATRLTLPAFDDVATELEVSEGWVSAESDLCGPVQLRLVEHGNEAVLVDQEMGPVVATMLCIEEEKNQRTRATAELFSMVTEIRVEPTEGMTLLIQSDPRDRH